MNVSKWGHSLAVRLPGKIVEALRLEPRASLDILESGGGEDAAEEAARRARFLAAMEKIRWSAPEDYKFDRDEANER
jgi:antitoxin MazE